MGRKFIQRFFIRSLVLILLAAGAVVLFDPFFQYHRPLPGLKAVLSDKEYQCIGTLRNFDYDSLIVGSSVAENYDNSWFDEDFGCRSIKAIRSYGATADLCYLLDEAFAEHELVYVFYSMDSSSLSASTTPTYESTGCPMYLYNKNPLDDVKYLLNKGVLMEKIPYMVANSLMGDYDEGKSYNWAQWKTFGEEQTLSQYYREPGIKPMLPEDIYETELRGNLELLGRRIEEHPQTGFKIFFPPYSMLWWDNICRTGELDAYLYNTREAMEYFSGFPNAELYYFQDREEIVTDLDNYMDTIHFSPEINHFMEQEIAAGRGRVERERIDEVIMGMRKLVEKIEREIMPLYEERMKLAE